FSLPDLDHIAPWVRAAEASDRQLGATYYDAADLRMVRAGVTLRHRSGEGGAEGLWTVKVPVPGKGGEDRTEVKVEGSPEAMPESVRAVVRGVLRTAELVPVARLVTLRHLVQLRDGGGRVLGRGSERE